MDCCCEQGNSQSRGTKLNHKQQRKLVCGFEVCLCSMYFIVVVQYTIDQKTKQKKTHIKPGPNINPQKSLA